MEGLKVVVIVVGVEVVLVFVKWPAMSCSPVSAQPWPAVAVRRPPMVPPPCRGLSGVLGGLVRRGAAVWKAA